MLVFVAVLRSVLSNLREKVTKRARFRRRHSYDQQKWKKNNNIGNIYSEKFAKY